jgi:hypothetical protein
MSKKPESARYKTAPFGAIRKTGMTGWLSAANHMFLLALAATSLCSSIKAQTGGAQRLSLRNVVEAINDQRMFDLAEVDKNAETAAKAYSKTCEVKTAQTTEETLSFYPPFSASDDITDVWCKMQTLHSDRPIGVSLNQDLGSGDRPSEIFVSDFVPDGNIHSSKADFIQHLVKEMSRQAAHGAPFWQSVVSLKSLGVPEASNAPRNVFNGNLTMTAYDVQISGVSFNISVTFAPQAGLIARQIQNPTETYLQFPAPMPQEQDQPLNASRHTTDTVGFPWALDGVKLVAVGQNIDVETPAIARTIKQKYQNSATSYDDAAPNTSSMRNSTKGDRTTILADQYLTIKIVEGLHCVGFAGFAPYLDIYYTATAGGPIDLFTPGSAEFNRYVANSKTRQNEAFADATVRNTFLSLGIRMPRRVSD